MENQEEIKKTDHTKTISEETGRKLAELLAKAPSDAAVKSFDFAKKPVVHIRNNQIIAGVIGTGGLVIFALGIENLISTIPALSSPYIEIGLGLVMLSTSGLLLKKLV